MFDTSRFWDENRDFIIAAAIFLATMSLYLRTLNPTIAFEDSGEFATLSYTLSLSHPPGYPLYIPMGKIFSLFPVGEIAFRINLMSACFGALIGVVIYFVMLLFFELNSLDCANRPIAAIVALLLVSSNYVWSLSIIDEVYSANSFFHCVQILLLLAWERQRRSLGEINSAAFDIRHLGILCAFSLYYGLNVGVHQSMILLAPPYVLFILLVDHKTLSARNFAILFFFMFVGISIYLFTPLRSASGPLINWGAPRRLPNFMDVVNRTQYGSLESGSRLSAFASQLGALIFGSKQVDLSYWRQLFKQIGFFDLPGQFTPLIFVLSLYGVYNLFMINLKHHLFMLFMFFMVTMGYVLIVSPPIPEQIPLLLQTFFLPISVTLAIYVGFGLSGIATFVQKLVTKPRMTAIIITTLGVILVSANVSQHYRTHDDSKHYFSFDYANNILRTMPEKSMIFTYLAQDTFPLWYNKYVRGLREDVVVIHQRLLALPWHSEQIERNNPDFQIPYGAKLMGNRTNVPLMSLAGASSRYAISKNSEYKLFFSNFNQPFVTHNYNTTISGLLYARYDDPFPAIKADYNGLRTAKIKADAIMSPAERTQAQKQVQADMVKIINRRVQAESTQKALIDRTANYYYRSYSNLAVNKDGRVREFENHMTLANLRASSLAIRYLKDVERGLFYGKKALYLIQAPQTRAYIKALEQNGPPRVRSRFSEQKAILLVNTLRHLGNIYYSTKDYQQALSCYEESLSIDITLAKTLRIKSENAKTEQVRNMIKLLQDKIAAAQG